MLLLAILGCYSGFPTDGGQLTVLPLDVVSRPAGGMASTDPVLAGTRLCAEITPAETLSCFDQEVDGPASFDAEGCLRVESPGDVRWRFEPASCGTGDGVTLTVVGSDALEASVHQWLEPELVGAEGLTLEGDAPANPEGEPFRVVAGGPLTLPVSLWHPDHDAPVVWGADDGAVRVETVSGSSAGWSSPRPGWFTASLGTDTRAEVILEVGEETWVAGALEGVAPSAAATLDLAVLYADEDGAPPTPLGARAVVRDAAGAALYGAPVSWSLDAVDAHVRPDPVLPGGDYVIFETTCDGSTASVAREATLTAEWNGLSDATVLRYTGCEAPGGDEEPEPTCGCASGVGAPIGVAALLAAAVARRRRR